MSEHSEAALVARCGRPWTEHPTANGEPYCEPSTCPTQALLACARCGLPALGFAMIGDQRVCHGDEERPSCYELGLWDQAVERMQGADDV